MTRQDPTSKYIKTMTCGTGHHGTSQKSSHLAQEKYSREAIKHVQYSEELKTSSSQNSPNKTHRIKKGSSRGIPIQRITSNPLISQSTQSTATTNRLKVSFQRIWYAAELLRLARRDKATRHPAACKMQR
jgi:hypothetical protein